MHKKLASDLTSLAHSILQMKNKGDVFALKHKAYEVYEKLSVLAYVEEYINNTPNPSKMKEELLQDILLAEEKKVEEDKVGEFLEAEDEVVVHQLDDLDDAIEVEAEDIAGDVINEIIEDEVDLKLVEEIIEQPFDEIESIIFEDSNTTKNDVKDVGDKKTPTLEDELQDTISVDVMADLFAKVEPKKSLNDHLQSSIQIGLNDRIAFVKHLFNGDQNDFNRVVSQLNTFKTEKEAKKFINKMIKPDYNWDEKEEYETRLFEIIERRFA